MLKHVGEALVPFEDDGYARYPEHPLTGEKVRLGCKVIDSQAIPVLHWVLEGVEQKPEQPHSHQCNIYTFWLSLPPVSCEVIYWFETTEEQTQSFSFASWTRHELGAPIAIVKADPLVYAVFTDDFSISFQLQDHLVMRALQASIYGEDCEQAELALDSEHILSLTKQKHFWELKRLIRLSSEQPSRELQAQSYSLTLYREKNGRIAKIEQSILMPCEIVLGTGERFDAVNQKHRTTDGMVVEKFTHQGNETYLPCPFFMTEKQIGWYRSTSIPVEMHFDDLLTLSQETEGNVLTEDHLLLGAPSAILFQYLSLTGKPVLPPDWAFGLWISANGWCNDQEVSIQLQALKENDYPASVMVLEAWSDERTFSRWNTDGSWENPAKTVQQIRDAGLHLVLWQIPIIKHEWHEEAGEALTADIQEAISQGYCILRQDGQPYRITDRWFHHSLLMDFTNPKALAWWFEKRKPLLDMGVEGFKTDGGEFLFDKAARLHNGQSGLSARNLYPNQYAKAYHDFMSQNNVQGVTFSRAGFAGAQMQPMHWAGDQCSEWCELQSQLTAGINAGLSGVLFWGFDIGGFAGELPTAELYLRATAMGCFSPVMQWHAEPRSGQFYATHEDGFNNDRSPWNLATHLHDSTVLVIAREFAKLRVKLMPYLLTEAAHCVNALRPMMAHLCVDFPLDAQAWHTSDEYMLGRKLLVAPIVAQGQTKRIIYLPKGLWRDYFTNEVYTGERHFDYECPLDRIPVFERCDGNA